MLLSYPHYGQIVADHRVVALYDDIPQQWIDSVKTMLVEMAGESHSNTFNIGQNLLERLDSRFQSTYYSDVPPETSAYLRIGKVGPSGEENYFTSQDSIDARKSRITMQNITGNVYDVMGFVWCWDMYYKEPPGGLMDPVYQVHWGGKTSGGPEGAIRWGLDSDDFALTGNSVCMDTYFDAVVQYQQHCINNGWGTKIIYTTGPVDDTYPNSAGTEDGFQREIKHDYIRAHVLENSDRILFDYADILCWNNEGEQFLVDWDDGGTIRPHAHLHPDNEMDYDDSWNVIPGVEDGDHIGKVGSLRLMKAMWWMLARIAGWEGSSGGEDITPPSVPTGLTVTSASQTTVSFSWNASSDNVGVSGYNIYRSGTFLGTTGGLSYTDNTVVACNSYTYTVSAFDAANNESGQSSGLAIATCPPDLTPTLSVSPNIMHGITAFNLIIRITELNLENTVSDVIVNIPKDSKWFLPFGFEPSLTSLGGVPLNNSDWMYTDDVTNHIFTSSVVIPAGGYSTLGLRATFNPDSTSGMNPITSQVVSGGGGEIRVNNNADSERLDYFQE